MSGFFGGLGTLTLAETATDPKRLIRALAKLTELLKARSIRYCLAGCSERPLEQ